MKKAISILLKYGLPIAISFGLGWFLYKNVDVQAIRSCLSTDVDYRWFALVIVVSIFSHIFRALRWQLQLHAIDVHAPLSALIHSIFGTYVVNLAFPRLGEVWRTGYIANRQRASFSKVLGSMVADRLSDSVAVGLLTIFTFFVAQDELLRFTSAQGKEGSSTSFTVTLLMLMAVGIAALVFIIRSKAETGIIAKLRTVVLNLWEGIRSIITMRGKWLFLLYTIMIWGCYYSQLYIASKAFTFTADLGLLPVLVLFVLSSIGMAVPSNGGLGPWQLAIIVGLALYGVGTWPVTVPYDAQASAFAWLVWGVQTVLLIVLGIYAFTAMAIDRRRIATGKTKVHYTNQDAQMTL